jgi:hypothetical protein
MKREQEIKGWKSRKRIEALVGSSPMPKNKMEE